MEQARAAKERARLLFARVTSVAGGGFGVKVNFSEPAPPSADLPESIDGVPECVEVVGTIRKR